MFLGCVWHAGPDVESWPCTNHTSVNFMHMQMCLNINFYSKWINVHLQWFEEKQQQIETLDQQLKKLHQSIEMLFVQRKGWCTIIEKEKKIFNFFIQLVVSIEKYLTRKQCLANIKFILLVSPTAFFASRELQTLLKSYASFCSNLGVFKEIQYRLESFFKDL